MDADAFRTPAHDTTYVEVTTNGGQSWNILGMLSNNEYGVWATETYSLSNYTGDNVKIRFRDVTDGTISANGTRIDDFMIEAIPTDGEVVLMPAELNFSAVGIGSSVSKNLIIKNLAGTLNVTGIDVNPPFSISYSGSIAENDSVVVPVSFSPQSAGEFNAVLTVNISGNYIGLNTINVSGTGVQAATSFLQTFDSATVPNLPQNWTKIRVATNTFTDVVVSANTSDAHSPDKFVKILNFPEDAGATLMLVSPATTNFDVNQLKFWSKTIWDNARFEVGTLSNPTDPTTFEAVSLIRPGMEYAEYSVDFTNVTGIKHIAFRKVCADSLSSVYIDDISWQNGDTNNPPSPAELVAPLDMAVNVINTPQLRWTQAAGSPQGYKLYMGTNNPPSNVVNAQDLGNVMMYNVSTVLSFNTTYYWQIVPYNQAGDAVNCPVWSFTTMEDPAITEFPWTENFDAYPGMLTPLGWTVLNLNNDTATWKTISNPNTTDIAYSQPTALHCPFSFATAQDDWIFTPPMSLTAGNQYHLSFKYHIMTSPEGAELPEKLEVKWGNGASVEAMNTEALYTNDNMTNTAYMTANATFSPDLDGNYNVGFHCYSDPMMWLLIIDDIQITEVLSNNDMLSKPVTLKQNYPNPFNPVTHIAFNLKNSEKVSLKIYNAKGQLVKTLVNQKMTAGNHTIVWNGQDQNNNACASGVYFYRLETQKHTFSKKMLLVK